MKVLTYRTCAILKTRACSESMAFAGKHQQFKIGPAPSEAGPIMKHPGESEVIANLLQRLNSANAGAAWAQFMDRFSPLIMKAVRQFEYTQDRAGDCFLNVCERLSDNGFHRLLRFNTRGTAKFSTWLGVVVFNLCVDWHRQEFGRAQLLPAISALPSFDQAVYRLRCEENLSIEACFETLVSDFPDLTRRQLSEAIARVHRALTPRQRWQIVVRNRRPGRTANPTNTEPARLPHAGPGPEHEAQTQFDLENLKTAMATLHADQRLLLHLRFQRGLTLKRIARIMRLGDPFRARRHVQAALEALSAALSRCEKSGQKEFPQK